MRESEYAFDNVAQQAGGRFSVLETYYDPVSKARMADLGIRPGWKCLEVGGGGGSLGRWLGQQVGPSGTVLVTDLDTRWIPGTLGDNVEIAVHDVRTDPLPQAEFDLIHARLVLWHLPERRSVLSTLADALRPGGVLMIEEFDTDRIQVLRAPSDEAALLFTRVHEALIATLEAHGGLRDWGTRAYDALCSAGLSKVAMRIHTEDWPGGSHGCELHRVNTEQLKDDILGRGVTENDLKAFWNLLNDPGFAVTSYPLSTVWGYRPL